MKTLQTSVFTLLFLTLAHWSHAQASFESPVKNPGFEAQQVAAPTGAILDWVSNSYRGTGTYPLPSQTADGTALPATPYGQQAVVIATGGFIGNTILKTDGSPLPIIPGSKITISFHNIPIPGKTPGNMGAYLSANNQDGGRIAEAIPVRNTDKVDGRISVDFIVYPAAKLDASAPGWQGQTAFFKLHNFIGYVVLDDIKVTVTAPAM